MKSQKNLIDNFKKVLGRKFIAQLGFHTLFKPIRKIGRGIAACVYSAIDYTNGCEIAIKSFCKSVYFKTDNNNGKVLFALKFRLPFSNSLKFSL
jgi:hypothetical protein